MKSPSEYPVDGIVPSRVVTPTGIDDLASALREVHGARESAVPWGGGTRMHVGGLPRRYDVAIDLTPLDRILEYEPADLTVTVEAGARVASVQAELASRGQRLPFDPPLPERATIGGSLASNAVGPLRSAFGGVRDLVIGMRVVHADGTVTKSGGKVVKNVSGYDLMRPHIGAFGTLGVIAEISFKLVPLPAATRTYAAEFRSLASARAACESLLLAPFQPERLTLLSGRNARGLLSRWRGSASPGSERAHLLVLTLAAGRAAVERMVNETRSIVDRSGASWRDVIGEADTGLVWSAIEPGGTDAPLLTARATFKPSAGFDYIGALESSADKDGLHLDTVFHVGFGTVLTHLLPQDASQDSRDTLDVASRTIESIHQLAIANGAVVVIERCPVDLKRRVDIWGDPGSSIEIMRNMKMQFDPDGTLNPGRFVGGI